MVQTVMRKSDRLLTFLLWKKKKRERRGMKNISVQCFFLGINGTDGAHAQSATVV